MRLISLTARYLAYHRLKTTVMVLCLSVLFLLPFSIHRLVDHYNSSILARARTSPLILGAKGNRYDLILKSLYFSTDYHDNVYMADCDTLESHGFGAAIPLHVRHYGQKFYDNRDGVATVERAPVVGTTARYFSFRGLTCASGDLPLLLGEAVAGARAAAKLDLKPGDYVLTTPRSAYDQAESFQLKMRITGILQPSDSPDDYAIFTDIKTAWVIDGIGHGHQDMLAIEDSILLNLEASTSENRVATEAVINYQEITDENIGSFHFHGGNNMLPATAVVLIPDGKKGSTMALGHYSLKETRELIVPAAVMTELMGFVFRVKQFMDANYLVVFITVFALLALVLLLSFRLRQREMETMFRIGCSRSTIAGLIVTEIALVLGASVVLSGIGSFIVTLAIVNWFQVFNV